MKKKLLKYLKLLVIEEELIEEYSRNGRPKPWNKGFLDTCQRNLSMLVSVTDGSYFKGFSDMSRLKVI